ncbi:hypothetical protein IM40_01325 [Candidatus Paracaedimonas acanthamoebae]|nr:hypothetical protein IM40_01325 [Candidatus Paracaedimonas acanthamoebae]
MSSTVIGKINNSLYWMSREWASVSTNFFDKIHEEKREKCYSFIEEALKGGYFLNDTMHYLHKSNLIQGKGRSL